MIRFSVARRCAVMRGAALGLAAALVLGGGGRVVAGTAWTAGPGYRSVPLAVESGGRAGFTRMSGLQTGVLFTNHVALESEGANQNLMNGAGLALGDVDGDGWCDIFLCNLEGSSALYRNLGQWRFADVTTESGLGNTRDLARGAVFADVDGDGDLDLVVTHSGQGARLWWNDGRGHFQDARAAELAANTGSTSVTLGDIDGDGDLDLYVANYGENTIRSGMAVSTRVVGGREVVVGRMRNRLRIVGPALVEYGEPDVLYRNEGQGRFSRVPWTDGTFRDETGAPLSAAPWDLGLTAVFRDINQDGFVDLYICNDFQDPDRIWINDGSGRFQAISREAFRLTSHFSMAVDFGDLDGDGWDDLMTTDMLSRSHELRMRQLVPRIPPIEHTLEPAPDRPQVRRNTLFLNRGDGTYVELANYAGVAAADWSWTVNFLDVDLDGYLDVLIGAGHLYDTQDLDASEQIRQIPRTVADRGVRVLTLLPRILTPNVAFRNRGDLTFEEMGQAWGFDATEVSHSLAFADLDADGDLDIVVNTYQSQALLLRNDCPLPRVAVRLNGRPPNTRGIGAELVFRGGSLPRQTSQMTAGGRYLAGDEPLRVFAARGQGPWSLDVRWPSGSRTQLDSVQPNHLYEIDETGAAEPVPEPHPAPPPVWFDDVSDHVNHRHQEDIFDEFARQPLIPGPQARDGPGLAWADVDGDGLEDLLVGASPRVPIAIFRNTGEGQFESLAAPPPVRALIDDTTSIVGPVPGRGGAGVLLAGLSQEVTGPTTRAPAIAFALSGASEAAALPQVPTPPGPLALADVDRDGDLDLFVGGRTVPGRYPVAGGSVLFLRVDPGWRVDTNSAGVWSGLGRVRGAVFSDVDADGRSDLVVTTDWGPLRLFRNRGDRFEEVTAAWGLDRYLGLWSGVTAGDFDGDGRLDLVAGNLGLNSAWQQVAPGPYYLYYGDFNNNGGMEIVEGYRNAELQQIVPWRQRLALEAGLPWLPLKFPTHRAFAQASLEQILAGQAAPTERLQVDFLGNAIFLNRGDHFEVRLLPREAQWAPAFGMVVADFDGDGHEDLFLAQNDYGVRPDDPRLDGGRGLLLQGDGTGDFRAVPGRESGVTIYGEQRAAAAADFDGDARMDLAVAEHDGPLHLFHNRGAKPGLGLRLLGAPGNPSAIGAVVRLRFGGHYGPAREIHGGSGWWSQDSPRLVLAGSSPPTHVEVRWPSGRITETAVPADASILAIDEEGALRVPPADR